MSNQSGINTRQVHIAPCPVQQGRDAAIAIGGAGVGDGAYFAQHGLILRTPIGAALGSLGALELLDLATPSVAVTAFTGKRPEAAMASATRRPYQ
jgi:hypothetical protein